MGIFDSILWGEKDINLQSSSQQQSSWWQGQQSDPIGWSGTPQTPVTVKVRPVIQEMTLIDTSVGENVDMDVSWTQEVVMETIVSKAPPVNEIQDVIASEELIVKTEEPIQVINSWVPEKNTVPMSPRAPQQWNGETLEAMGQIQWTWIDLTPDETAPIKELIPGQDAWAWESSIHKNAFEQGSGEKQEMENTEEVIPVLNEAPAITEEVIAPVSTSIEEPVSFIIPEGEVLPVEDKKELNLNEPAPIIDKMETSDTIDFSWIFGAENNQSKPEEIIPPTPAPIEESISFIIPEVEPAPIAEKMETKIEPILSPFVQSKKEEFSLPNIPSISSNNPKEIVKTSIEQLQNLKNVKLQDLKNKKQEASSYREEAKKMHEKETETRWVIQNIEREIVQIGELIELFKWQLSEDSTESIQWNLVKTPRKKWSLTPPMNKVSPSRTKQRTK